MASDGMSAPETGLMNVKVFSAGSGDLIWGPTKMSSISVVGDVAAAVRKSEMVSFMHDGKKLDACELLSGLQASESDVLSLVAIFTPWSTLLDEKFPSEGPYSSELLEYALSRGHSSPELPASERLQEIEKSCCCSELPADVKACLLFFLEERSGKGPFFECPFTLARRHQPGLLYWARGEEDTMFLYWIDIFGQFGEILGIPAKEACGSVWELEQWFGGDSFDEDIAAFRRRLNYSEAAIKDGKSFTIEEWKDFLLNGVDGCSVYSPDCNTLPRCAATSLPDFLLKFTQDRDGDYHPPVAAGPDSWKSLAAEVLRKQALVHEERKLEMEQLELQRKKDAAQLELQRKKELQEMDKNWGVKGDMQDMDAIDISVQRGLELEAGRRKDQAHKEHLRSKEARKHLVGHHSHKPGKGGKGYPKGVETSMDVKQSANKITFEGSQPQGTIKEQTTLASSHYVERDKVSGARQIVSKAYSMDLPPSDDEDDLDS